MFELLRTPDPVLLSLLSLRLQENGITAMIFDDHTCAAYGGALPDVQKRLMVADDDVSAARRVLAAVQAAASDG